MTRTALFMTALAAVALSAPATDAVIGRPTVEDIANAITELDVERARKLLESADSSGSAVALERARLSLFVGDCDTAAATLRTLGGVKSAGALGELAKNCARATAGSVVIEDKQRGIWFRLQDEGDKVLVPVLSEVAGRARTAIERDLGIVLPRPLRIDLVRDLFSLSAVSGLPLQAAETTGTVAVARWGRVNMISPRAAPGGYPWEDTLAHEMTHLALSRATRDTAPLWLQEGLAKREETRWRPERPFDGEPDPDLVAHNALVSGESVGVDKLGPSIAMLPSADAATIAFAEVASFVGYFVREKGKGGLMLLFADLKGLGSDKADAALTSTSGYDLGEWIRLWQAHLRTVTDRGPAGAHPADPRFTLLMGEDPGTGAVDPIDARSRVRSVRLGDLLFARGAPLEAVPHFRGVFGSDTGDPSIRWRFGKSLIASGRERDAAPLFDSLEGVESAHPGWFGLAGRFGSGARAIESFDMAVALNPYLEDAACEGHFKLPGPAAAPGAPAEAPFPADPGRRALCESARKIPPD